MVLTVQHPGLVFQRYNTRPHTARLTRRDVLQRHNIKVPPWLLNSPELSHIENGTNLIHVGASAKTIASVSHVLELT